ELLHLYPSKAHPALNIEKTDFIGYLDRTKDLASIREALEMHATQPERSSIQIDPDLERRLVRIVLARELGLARLEAWLEDTRRELLPADVEAAVNHTIHLYVASLNG